MVGDLVRMIDTDDAKRSQLLQGICGIGIITDIEIDTTMGGTDIAVLWSGLSQVSYEMADMLEVIHESW